MQFFLAQLACMGRSCCHICTDLGGELCRRPELCWILKEKLHIVLKRTGTYFYWLNGKIEHHNQTSCEMIHVGTIDHGLSEQLWCCKCEDSTDKYNTILHSAHGDIPDFMWYGVCPNISDFRIFGCKVEAIIGNYLSQLDARTEDGYYIGTTTTKVVICYWCPSDPTTIQVWMIQKHVHFFKLHGKQYGFGIFFNPWMCYNNVLHQHLKTTKQLLPKFWMIDSYLVCSTLIFLLHVVHCRYTVVLYSTYIDITSHIIDIIIIIHHIIHSTIYYVGYSVY